MAVQADNQEQASMAAMASSMHWIPRDDADYHSFDELVHLRAKTHADSVLVSYPTPTDDGTYTDITGAHLEALTRTLAVIYAKKLGAALQRDLLPDVSATGLRRCIDDVVVAITGPSTLSYAMTYVALQRLGVCTMHVSQRLADVGTAHLLRVCKVSAVLAVPGPAVEKVQRARDELGVAVPVIPMFTDEELLNGADVRAREDAAAFVLPPLDVPGPDFSPLVIMHTGGTTGLPKPIHFRSAQWLDISRLTADGLSPFVLSLPLFHAFGNGGFIASLVGGVRLVLLRADRPVTAAAILRALDAVQAQRLGTVPYLLRFIAETPGGVERLARLALVMTGSAPTPEDLGSRLVRAGVRLHIGYGQTESGILMRNTPEETDSFVELWDWITPIAAAAPYIRWEEVDGGLLHLVVADGCPSLRLHDRPDGSYGTKDLFVRHPTLPDRYKYVGRSDDMIVLVNGEKADPGPLQDALNNNPNVQVSLAFGAGRDALGMIVIPSEKAAGMSHDQLIESILPDLEMGNARSAAWARVTPDSLIIKPIGTPFPMTDKSTVIRPQFIKQFEKDITRFYQAKEEAENDAFTKGEMELSDAEVGQRVRQIIEKELHLEGTGEALADDTDFFSLGMDSLQAVHVRTRIIKTIPLGGAKLATNETFDHPSIAQLTAHINELRKGKSAATNGHSEVDSIRDLAHELVQKYTPIVNGALGEKGVVKAANGHDSQGAVVLFTGATGYIGRHILHTLLLRPNVRRVICLTRAESHSSAHARLLAALSDGFLLETIPQSAVTKLTGLAADLSAPSFGLSADEYGHIHTSVTHIVHNAWPVNFNMGLASFEKQAIVPTAALLHLAQSASRARHGSPVVFTFVSSIASSIAGKRPVPETINSLNAAVPLGYGLSKGVAEQLCAAAAAAGDVRVRIARVGQVSGDTVHGMWNPVEAVPAIVQSATTIGALPIVDGRMRNAYWLPADVCGRAIVELTLLDCVNEKMLAMTSGTEGKTEDSVPNPAVFNVFNQTPVRWNEVFLSVCERAGLRFEKVHQSEWLRRLEAVPDARRNPPYKLVQHYRTRFAELDEREADAVERMGTGCEMARTKACAPSLATGVNLDEELLGKYVQYWIRTGWSRSTSGKL